MSISQNVYPSKVIYKGDTACIISISQVEEIALNFIDLDACNAEKRQLKDIIDTCASLVTVQGMEIDNLTQQLRLTNNIVLQERAVINNLDKAITSLKKADRITKFERNILLLIGGYLAFQILTK